MESDVHKNSLSKKLSPPIVKGKIGKVSDLVIEQLIEPTLQTKVSDDM